MMHYCATRIEPCNCPRVISPEEQILERLDVIERKLDALMARLAVEEVP